MSRVVDLFAGCGGMSRGFLDAGFEVVGAFEFWNVAADCYEMNYDHPVFRADLSDVQNAVAQIKALHPDVIIGGPPCQDFSHAGLRVEADRAGLTGSFADIISAVRPTAFVMENVDRVVASNAYGYARNVFRQAGYGLTELVLDASLCGVPQKRKRFFCIGLLNSDDNFAADYVNQQLSPDEMTLHAYFGDILGFDRYYRHPRNYNRRAIFSVNEPAPTMRGVNRPIPDTYNLHPNDAGPLGGGVRSLTTLERALIQTFPGDYKWAGSKTEIEQMIGNAVPVKLAQFVATALLVSLAERAVADIDCNGFQSWLNENKDYTERTKHDMVSRVRRSHAIVPIDTAADENFYIFRLEQTNEYNALSASIRSQLKRAVSLYFQFDLQRPGNARHCENA